MNTTRPEVDAVAEDALRPILKKHGFLRVLRWLEGEALKHGSLSGVMLAGQIDPKKFRFEEPLDAKIGGPSCSLKRNDRVVVSPRTGGREAYGTVVRATAISRREISDVAYAVDVLLDRNSDPVGFCLFIDGLWRKNSDLSGTAFKIEYRMRAEDTPVSVLRA